MRKDDMQNVHSTAERAKARRQAEEEQREAQKERARQKAAEIEKRIKSEQKDEEEAPKSPSVSKFQIYILNLWSFRRRQKSMLYSRRQWKEWNPHNIKLHQSFRKISRRPVTCGDRVSANTTISFCP